MFAMQHLLRLMREDRDLVARIADPAQTDLDTAITLMRMLRKADPQAEFRLLRLIMPDATHTVGPEVLERVVALLEVVVDGPKLLPLLLQYFRIAGHHIRARLTTLIGKHHRNRDWVNDRLNDLDPRVRANIVEAHIGEASSEAIEVFCKALRDQTPRVVANAALGLYKAGLVDALDVLGMRLGCSSAAADRASAAWAMSHTGDLRFQQVLAKLVKDENPAVRKHAFRALGELRRQSVRNQEKEVCALQFLKVHRAGEGVLHIFFSVRSPNTGQPLKNLKALQISLTENEVPIFSYQLQERIKYPEPGVYDVHFRSEHPAVCASKADATHMLKVEITISSDTHYGSHASYWFGE